MPDKVNQIKASIIPEGKDAEKIIMQVQSILAKSIKQPGAIQSITPLLNQILELATSVSKTSLEAALEVAKTDNIEKGFAMIAQNAELTEFIQNILNQILGGSEQLVGNSLQDLNRIISRFGVKG